MPKYGEDFVPHTLFSREIRPIRNWSEWLDRWQMVVNTEEMIGLLHVGFFVSMGRYNSDEKEYAGFDRLKFYFQIADGWRHSDFLRTSGAEWHEEKEYDVGLDKFGNIIRKSESHLRQEVAHKAFDVLCRNFFKEELLLNEHYHHDTFKHRWIREIKFPRLFPLILLFLELKRGNIAQNLLFEILLLGTKKRLTMKKQRSSFSSNSLPSSGGGKGRASMCRRVEGRRRIKKQF